MKGFRHLLVPLDFSHASARAIEAALQVAEPGARIRLLHVVEWVPTVVEGTVSGYSSARDVRVLHRASEEKLRAYASRCAGTAVETQVVEGQIARTILEEAARGPADLIVLARRSRNAGLAIRPTRTLARVMRSAPCAVLVVPP